MDDKLLEDFHRQHGAHFEAYRGQLVPAFYAADATPESVDDATDDVRLEALRREHAAITGNWGVRVSGGELLVLSGPDRERFLNGQTTCDVANMQDGEGRYGFFTTAKGRVESEVVVLADGDRLWLALPPGMREPMEQRLGKYKVFDQVDIQNADMRQLQILGPRATGAIEALMDEAPRELHHYCRVTVGDDVVIAVRERAFGGVPVWSLWTEALAHLRVVEQLLDIGEDTAPSLVGFLAVEHKRIEAGEPLFGVDFGLDHFPQESGRGEEAVCYTKGCYLGQEVVARIHYRGGVQRSMHRLMLDEPAAVGSSIEMAGRKVGVLTSLTPLASADGRWHGLAVLHNKVDEDDTVDVEVVSIDGEGRRTADVGPLEALKVVI